MAIRELVVGVAVCSLVAVIVRWNTLKAEFVYDDNRAILGNRDLRPETLWTNLMVNDFWGTPLRHKGSHKSYRPLTVLSFRINYFFSGLEPFSYHATNVAMHAFVVAYVFFLTKWITHRLRLSYFTALFFAVMPVHTEAVAGVVGRADILATVFFLLSVHSYLYGAFKISMSELNGGTPWTVVSILMAFLSTLSKEHGITALGVCTLLELLLLLRRSYILKSTCKRRPDLTLLILGSAAILIWRLWTVDFKAPIFSPHDNPTAYCKDYLTRWLTFLYLPIFNLQLVLCPTILSFDWSMNAVAKVESLSDMRTIVSALSYALLACMVLVICVMVFNGFGDGDQAHPSTPHSPRRKSYFAECKTDINGNPLPLTNHTQSYAEGGKRTDAKPVKSACLVKDRVVKEKNGASGQSKLTGGNPNINEFDTAERCLHDQFPLLGLIIMIVSFLPASNTLFYVGFVVAERVLYLPTLGYCMLLACALESFLQRFSRCAMDWCHFLIMFLWITLAVRSYVRNEDWKDELSLYTSGASVIPQKAYANLGRIYSTRMQLDIAERMYKTALSFDSNMADTWYNYGLLLQELSRDLESVRAYRNAIRIRPHFAVAHLNLGIVLTELGRREEAKQYYESCATLSSDGVREPLSHNSARISCMLSLGKLYLKEKNPAAAMDHFHRVLQQIDEHYDPKGIRVAIAEAFVEMEQSSMFAQAQQSGLAKTATGSGNIQALLACRFFQWKKGQLEKSRHSSESAVHRRPDRMECYDQLNMVLSSPSDKKSTIEALRRSLQIDSNDFNSVIAIANAYREPGQNGVAEELY